MRSPPHAPPEGGDHDAVVAFLSDANAYQPRPKHVDVIETHTSRVFLAGDLVYKIKKPVQLSFVDFRSLEARRLSCEREVALNRTLAPGVYLGSLPVVRLADGSLSFQGAGDPVEWFVLMRRLDKELLLDHCCQSGKVRPEDVDRLCDRLAVFYRRARRSHLTAAEFIETWRSSIALAEASLTEPAFGLPPDIVRPPLDALQRFMERDQNLLIDRLSQGCIIDGHGDLRPQHVYVGAPTLVIDRLEFDDRLRQVDPFDEIGSLGLECQRLGCRWVGEQLFGGLSERLDIQPPLPQLMTFYRVHRACMRARLSIEHLRDEKPRTAERWPQLARAYLALALSTP